MKSELKPYPEMQDPGVRWLGKIPAHWSVRRLRNVVEMRISNVDKHTREGERPVRLCNYVDVYKNNYIRSGMDFMEATAKMEEVERFRLRSQDVLITKDSEAWNDIGVPALVQEVEDDVVSGYHLALLRSDTRHLDGEFLFRTLQSRDVACQLHVQANGVTRYGLSHNAIKSVQLPIPPVPEQSAIVRFLDYAGRRIRRSIRAKEKLIALLEEQKQAVIHQAVTGRIDVRTGRPYPAYKPSGVEWLGEVPVHWGIHRIKNWLAVNQSVLPEDTNPDYMFDYLEIGSIGTGRIVEAPETVRFENSPSRARRIVKPGDTIVSTVRTYLKAVWHAEHPNSDLVASTGFAVLTPRSGAYPKFVSYLCQSEAFTNRVMEESVGVAYPAIAETKLVNFHVGVPPVPEQSAIVHFLDHADRRIRRYIARARREIDLLEEYRTRLIADVVTGKLDVREAAVTLPVDPDGPEEPDDPDAAGTDCAEPEGGDDSHPHRDRRTEVPATQREIMS